MILTINEAAEFHRLEQIVCYQNLVQIEVCGLVCLCGW